MDTSLIPYLEGDLEHYTSEEIKEIERTGLKPGDYIYSDYYSPRKFIGFRRTEYGLKVVSEYVRDGKEDLIEPENFWRHNYYRLPYSPEEIHQKVIEAIQDHTKFSPSGTEETSDTTALMTFSPQALEAMKQEMEEKRQLVKVLEMQIDKYSSQLSSYVRQMEKFIGKVQKVLGIFELYLGVNEEIIQIHEGPKASDTAPIHVRQLILYADEEYGSEERGGLDWQTVEEFDNWLVDSGEWKTIAPEEKCIVGIKPRRRDKEYSKDPVYNAFMNAGNKMLYLIIRNGECLCRIYTDKGASKTLFPTEEEMSEVYQRMNDPEEYGFRKEDAQDEYLALARNALLIQGLFDRTEIFLPSAFRINVQDPNDPNLIFVRDAEMQLPTGRLPFKEWQKKINEGIDVGSRVLIIGNLIGYRVEYRSRFKRYYSDKSWNIPDAPSNGVYVVEERFTRTSMYNKNSTEYFVILYQPGGHVLYNWGYDWEDRKNRVSFLIKPEDKYVLHYDFIDPDDIDFYLTSRIDRPNYLDMMPILKEIKKQLQKEKEYEKDLVRLIANRIDVPENKVWNAVHWWKTKNKWKRFIRDDDAKALRMIEKKLLKEKEHAT
jgi:hypothetical protein